MFNNFSNGITGMMKWLVLLGIIVGVSLFVGLKGFNLTNPTNEYDAKNTTTISDTTVKLKEMENKEAEKVREDQVVEKSAQATADVKINRSNNETSIEMKKLDTEARKVVDQNAIEQKKTLDVNAQAQREFELEKMRIQLLEAQKIKNELEIEKLKVEKLKSEKEAKIKADAKKVKARAAAQAAKAKARREAEKEELETLKMLAQ